VTGYVDDVVHAARDPVVAVFVTPAAVAGEVEARVLDEIGLEETFGITEHAAHHARPGALYAQVANARAGDLATILIDDGRLDTEERQRSRAGFDLHGARQRGDQDAAGLGLPPGVHDRAVATADEVVVPEPDFGVDGLAHGAQHTQGGEVVLLYPVVALARDGASSGSSVEMLALYFSTTLQKRSGVG
jgi:hypothetical protein